MCPYLIYWALIPSFHLFTFPSCRPSFLNYCTPIFLRIGPPSHSEVALINTTIFPFKCTQICIRHSSSCISALTSPRRMPISSNANLALQIFDDRGTDWHHTLKIYCDMAVCSSSNLVFYAMNIHIGPFIGQANLTSIFITIWPLIFCAHQVKHFHVDLAINFLLTSSRPFPCRSGPPCQCNHVPFNVLKSQRPFIKY